MRRFRGGLGPTWEASWKQIWDKCKLSTGSGISWLPCGHLNHFSSLMGPRGPEHARAGLSKPPGRNAGESKCGKLCSLEMQGMCKHRLTAERA